MPTQQALCRSLTRLKRVLWLLLSLAMSSTAARTGGIAHASALHPAFADARALSAFVRRLPKSELHVHIEGTLEVDMLFAMARRNNVQLPYADEAAARRARSNFTCLDVRMGPTAGR
jgi:hypothetical protein